MRLFLRVISHGSSPLSVPHLSLGGSCSIWAELEGLLAGEIVFIQCIYNQAPYLSVHLSLSHTHYSKVSLLRGQYTLYTRLHQHGIQRRPAAHGWKHTNRDFLRLEFNFCSLSVCSTLYTPAAWSHGARAFGNATHIHACALKETRVKCLQAMSVVGLCL